MTPETPEKPASAGDRAPKRKKAPKPSKEHLAQAAIAEEAAARAAVEERKLAVGAAIAIPLTTVFAASVVGLALSLGPAILVLAAGTLLGTIALFWGSLRTLTGDAPLSEDLEHASMASPIDALADRKRMLLRALKDLESEHAVGKIDARDYASLASTFREEIKTLMREMDDSLEPHLAEAERLVTKHFAKIGLTGDPFRAPGRVDQAKDEALARDDAAPASITTSRVACPACEASNEPDARFCKSCGGPLAAAGAEGPLEDPAAPPAPAPDEVASKATPAPAETTPPAPAEAASEEGSSDV